MITESMADIENTICFTCHYRRPVISGKGSFFIQCEMHFINPDKYSKYPALPVLNCSGYLDITERNG